MKSDFERLMAIRLLTEKRVKSDNALLAQYAGDDAQSVATRCMIAPRVCFAEDLLRILNDEGGQ